MDADPEEISWADASWGEFARIAYGVRDSARPIDAISKLRTLFIRRANDHWTLLHWFCNELCSNELLVRLIDAGVPVDARNMEGETAMHLAASYGSKSKCNLLLKQGADLDATSIENDTPLHYSVFSKDAKLVVWLLDQPRSNRLRWDHALFRKIMELVPEAGSLYLDKFALDVAGTDNVEFFDLRSIYGDPQQDIDETALSIAVEFVAHVNVLGHRIISHIIWIKWRQVKWIFSREMAAYLGLLLSYYATIISETTLDWIDLKSARDFTILALRILAWLCCVYLVIFVERKEFASGKYFRSIWNWLNAVTYGIILAFIPIECLRVSTSSTRHGILALIVVLLWANLPQYLRIFRETGLLIATMRRMVHDLRHFFVLYSVFLFGVSGGLHLILSDDDGYKTFVDTILTVLLMLFGNLTYDPFNAAAGWKWFFANLLLLTYLVCVVVMLLNILIAMMTTSYDLIREQTEEQFNLHSAETILRIDRSFTFRVREKQFKQLVSDADDRKPTTPFNFLSRIMGKSIHADLVMSKIQPLEVLNAMSPSLMAPNKKAKRRLKPLDDGIRFDRTSKSRSRAISAEMEARFDNLQALALSQASVNEETSKQVCALKDTIMELHNCITGMKKEIERLSCATSDSIENDQQTSEVTEIENFANSEMRDLAETTTSSWPPTRTQSSYIESELETN